jgi:hypothetical protein
MTLGMLDARRTVPRADTGATGREKRVEPVNEYTRLTSVVMRFGEVSDGE